MNAMMLKLNKIKSPLLSTCIFLLLWIYPFSSLQALELSGAYTFPPGGIINSIYLSGSPVPGGTIKVKTENDIEYTGFLATGGAFGIVSIEKIDIIGGDGVFGVFAADAYSIIGASFPLSLNAGAGVYLFRGGGFGLRLQHTALVMMVAWGLLSPVGLLSYSLINFDNINILFLHIGGTLC